MTTCDKCGSDDVINMACPHCEEFSLSAKRFSDVEEFYVYPEEDVKEFIKRLKDVCIPYRQINPEYCKKCPWYNDSEDKCEMNKLAGPDLI